MAVFIYSLLGVYVVGLVVSILLLLEARRETRKLRESLPTTESFERSLLADLVVMTYVPRTIRPSVESYFRGELDFEELQEQMLKYNHEYTTTSEGESHGPRP